MGLLEVAKRMGGGLDGVQKATESFRNEMVAMNRVGLGDLVEAVKESRHAIDNRAKR
jgi:hypothetical protein